ncbi:MAG: NAD(P)H-dependent glycerol-3-phosphate dehydrogenase [Bacteroidota bacterium]|nr:NAD(P)H-dependent glycerol-3-phosphate dehydrogenase [Bacteroidota bacterium]
MNNTVIIGAGAIGTALGNAISYDTDINIQLLTIEKEVADHINRYHKNHLYFPYIDLNTRLTASLNPEVLRDADFIFLAIPSSVTISYLNEIREFIPANSILINLAKGFGNGSKSTIVELLKENFSNETGSLKGPTFARELIENSPTAFTFACENPAWFKRISDLFEKTVVYCDFTTDIKGVELMSILKNIYAIVLGITDARFNSPNLRFMLLTNTFKELRKIVLKHGGQEDSLFKYCGIGDFGLTSLNDLSRNRTLGLFIGKGFFTKDISDKVLLEGKLATRTFYEKYSIEDQKSEFPIIWNLYQVFCNDLSIHKFIDNIFEKKTDSNQLR